MKFLPAALILGLALTGCTKPDASGNGTAAATPVAAVAAPAGQTWTDVVTKTPEGGFRMGNPNAPLKLIEYGARLCPACGAFAREGFAPLTSKYVASGKVSFEFRDFLIHGPAELALAALGQCGGPAPFFPILEQTYRDQDKFVAKWQAMTPAQQSTAGKTAPQIALTFADATGAIDYVKQRGISDAKARQCLGDEKQLEAIAKVTDTASSNGTVTGTPTFLLNGDKIDAISWPQMEPILKARGA